MSYDGYVSSREELNSTEKSFVGRSQAERGFELHRPRHSSGIFFIRIVGSGTGSTRHVGHWMAYCTCPGWLWWWWIWWNKDWQGKTKYSEKTWRLSYGAAAQAVSRWLPTAATQVQARVCSCGICGGQSGAGAGFLRVLIFPLPIFIPPIAPQ
jgi:hypothetical protein